MQDLYTGLINKEKNIQDENERDKLSILAMAVPRPLGLPGAKLLVLLRAGSSITRAYFWQVDL